MLRVHLDRCSETKSIEPPSRTDVSIVACPSIRPAFPSSACALPHRAIHVIMSGALTNSATVNMPAQQDQHDDAALEDQVGRGHFEGHPHRKIRSAAKQ